jgi:hypothetical protein
MRTIMYAFVVALIACVALTTVVTTFGMPVWLAEAVNYRNIPADPTEEVPLPTNGPKTATAD